MEQDEIIELLSHVATPVYQIEVNLGMPKTTLQKAMAGERSLPKKWVLKLIEAYPQKKEVVVKDLNIPTNKIEPQKSLGSDQSNFTIDTMPKENNVQRMLRENRELLNNKKI